MTSYKTISSIFTFFNFLLLLIVVLSPNWFAYYANIDLYFIGLWTICSEKFGCRFMKDVDVYMNIGRVFLILGLVASVTSVLWTQVVMRNKLFGGHFRFPPPALMASILSFNAGLSMLVAILIFETKINDEQSALAHKKKWAFYLSYIIMILWFFIGVYNLVCHKCSLWKDTIPRGSLSSSKNKQEEEATAEGP